MGHAVVEASDGPQMLELLRLAAEPFDLIISDYAMPLISGAEAIRRARELYPDIPAIMITGYAEAASVADRPSHVHLLLKPFRPEQMTQAIAGAIDRDPVSVAA
jgi:CheY-like chemotaxis protein